MFRSRRLQMFFKIVVFKVCKFLRKAPVLESSLIKLQALKTATLLKRDSNTGYLSRILWIAQKHLFCVEDVWTAGSETPVRLFKNTFFNRTFPVAASDSFRFPPAALLKKGLQQRRFSVRFAKFLRTSFYKTPPDDCFLCLPVILRSFSDHLFYRAPLGNCLFHVQVAEFQPPDTIKSISQVLFKEFTQKRNVAMRRCSFT